MNLKLLSLFTPTLTILVSLSGIVLANENDVVNDKNVFNSEVIMQNELNSPPIIDSKNSYVFARFTEEMPMVVNYFTSSTEDQIITFYQEHYGDIVMTDLKRGRLSLSFEHNEQHIRVIISQQNKKRQVDVIVENK